MKAHIRNLFVVLVTCVIACVLVPGPALAASYKYVGKFGTQGTGARQFDGIAGIAIDRSGNVYVSDVGNKRIEKFGANGGFAQWGTLGDAPDGIAVDGSGNVYVADYYGGRILRFNSSGGYLTQFSTTIPGDFLGSNPHSVAVDSAGNIWVTDAQDSLPKKFDSGGTYLGSLGSVGNDAGQFQSPCGIAVDSSDNVFVVDYTTYMLQEFSPSGAYLGGHVTFATGDGSNLLYPVAVCSDHAGNTIVADTYSGQFSPSGSVKKFSGSYVLQTRIGTRSTNPALDGTFNDVTGVAVSPSGDVYLADSSFNRVIQFRLPAGSQSTKTSLSAPSSAKVKKALKLSGTISAAGAGGSVKITKTRKVGSKWKSMGSAKVKVTGGKFVYTFKPSAKGSWRFVAAYSGGGIYAASKSTTKTVKVK